MRDQKTPQAFAVRVMSGIYHRGHSEPLNMHFPETSIENLPSFGYLVATHSGYFSMRQYLDVTGAKSGEKSMAFTQKVLGKGHATARLLLRNGRVYHLFSRLVYRAIGRENLHNLLEHSAEHIRTKLAILDFVLAHLNYRYLETEAEKVDYFCGKLEISRALLPAKRYSGAIRQKSTDRYFVDKVPLFFVPESPLPPVVTSSFVDPGLIPLASFETHLLAYGSLFSALPALRFIYIATRATHFESAQKLFLTMMRRTPNTDPVDEVLPTGNRAFSGRRFGKRQPSRAQKACEAFWNPVQ